MKVEDSSRLAVAELNWGHNPSAILWIGSRAVHQYWALLAPYFRDVLLTPQRRAEDQIIAWSWREERESRVPTGAELAALRKRLAGDLQAFVDNVSAGAEEGRGLVAAGNAPGIGQIAAAMEGWVSRLLAMSDNEFVSYVACTESGLRLHSWGLTTAVVPRFPETDKAKTESEGGDGPEEPDVVAGNAAVRSGRARRRMGLVLLTMGLLAGGVWAGRQAWGAIRDEQRMTNDAGPRREVGGFNLRKLWQRFGGTSDRPLERDPVQASEKKTAAVGSKPDPAGLGTQSVSLKAARSTGKNDSAKSVAITSAGEAVDLADSARQVTTEAAATSSASDSTVGGGAATNRYGVATGGVSAAPAGGGGAAAPSVTTVAPQSELASGGSPRAFQPQTTNSGTTVASASADDPVARSAMDSVGANRKNDAGSMHATQERMEEAKAATVATITSTDDGRGTVVTRGPERADAASTDETASVRSLLALRDASEESRVAMAETSWTRVVRVQAGEWRVRLLGETILPTQPVRAGEEVTFETMRAQMLAERRAQLPVAFASVRGRRGFAVESESGPLQWRIPAGADTISAQADGNRAEIFWAEGAAPSSEIYEAVDEQGRAVARLEVGADRTPVLSLTAETRGWCWFTLDGEVTSFIGRRLSLETMPSAWHWTMDAHGAHLQIPLTTSAGTAEVETVALVDPATGWAIISQITLTATSSPR